MSEKQLFVSVPVDEYEELVRDQAKLRSLENGGVDNWEWYGEALKEFAEMYPDE